MLVIQIQLWPQGDQSKARHLGTMAIANDGTGTAKRGNYNVALSTPGPGGKTKTCKLSDFPRQSYTAWNLLHRALNILKPR